MSVIEVNWKPDRGRLGQFGAISFVAIAAIGTWIYFRYSLFGFEMAQQTARNTAYVLWAVAALCGVLGLIAPVMLRPLYVALTAISLPIGFVLSHVFMALLFYGVFTPIGLISRLAGRDPLCRKFDSETDSYWEARRPIADVKRYFRQF